MMVTVGLMLVGAGCTASTDVSPVTLENGVTFDVPSEWIWLDFPSDDSVRFETSQDPYNVIEKIDVFASDQELVGEGVIEETENATIYANPCGGALACYYVEFEDGLYEVYWNIPSSNQEPPEDLDGIWHPDHNVTKDVILEVMRTFRSE